MEEQTEIIGVPVCVSSWMMNGEIYDVTFPKTNNMTLY